MKGPRHFSNSNMFRLGGAFTAMVGLVVVVVVVVSLQVPHRRGLADLLSPKLQQQLPEQRQQQLENHQNHRALPMYYGNRNNNDDWYYYHHDVGYGYGDDRYYGRHHHGKWNYHHYGYHDDDWWYDDDDDDDYADDDGNDDYFWWDDNVHYEDDGDDDDGGDGYIVDTAQPQDLVIVADSPISDNWIYTPVDPDKIVPITGGAGGRSGRTLSEVRFNKAPPVLDGYSSTLWQYAPSRDYTKGVHQAIFPLLPGDYPVGKDITKEVLMRRETMADSVMVEGDQQLYGAVAATYLDKVKQHGPHYPSSDQNAPYWDELRHVIHVQQGRREGAEPVLYSRWPDLWADFDMTDIAKAVQNEYPASLQQQLIESLFKTGIEMDHAMMPFRSVVDFVGAQIRIAALNTWTPEAVGPINFLLKWTVGMPRPEEMAWLIASGAFTVEDGVPQDVVDSLKSMNLQHAADFTAYEDGSPMHPSWPAMHAAASVCSYWLPAVANLTPEQFCEALRVDYAVAYARTVAGVHYPMDNYAGLNIGLEIVKEKLPDLLHERYGYDADKVKAKLELLAFKWEDFDSYACTIEGQHVEKWLKKVQ